MKNFFVVLMFLLSSHTVFGQSNYDQALGIRAIGGFTISYKNYFGNQNNMELQAAIWTHGTRFAGLYEFNHPVADINGLNFILGPGVHLGFWNGKYKDQHSDAGTEFGIDGIIGLDYGFSKIPINISVDWQPSIILAGGSDFTPNLGGIGIRYTF
ncbi:MULTISPECIES: hypothetical protein [Chitinophagaceae]